MYSVQMLSKMYGCTRQTMYNRLDDIRLKEYVLDDNGKKLLPDGLNMLNLVMSEGRTRQSKDNQKDEPLTPKVDEMTQKYIAELERQINVLNGDKERLFFELQEQRKILLLASGEIKKKWWKFWNK
jgi:hypothetical protein